MIRRLALALLFVLAVALGACSSDDGLGSGEDENGTGGPAAVHPGWFKTPEAIAETVATTWELSLTAEERDAYLHGVRASLGGVSVAQQGGLLDRPNELYVLSVHALSTVLAKKLVDKQIEKTAANAPYMFDGLGLSPDDDGCYADDAKDWCDGKDGVAIGELSAAGVDAAQLPKAWRKRLMHKMQSIGEFFFLAIDERTEMPGAAPGSSAHAPAFLVDEVFLPKLREAGAGGVEQERLAWEEVVYTILMSGWYFDLPADP